MQLADLAATPQLKSIIIDDEEIVTKYGETVEFFIYDRMPLGEYLSIIANATDETDLNGRIEFASTLMLDKKGKPIFTAKKQVPGDLAMAAVRGVMAELGNL